MAWWWVLAAAGVRMVSFDAPGGAGIVVWRAEQGCATVGSWVGCGEVRVDPSEVTIDLDGPAVRLRLVGGPPGWTGRCQRASRGRQPAG